MKKKDEGNKEVIKNKHADACKTARLRKNQNEKRLKAKKK